MIRRASFITVILLGLIPMIFYSCKAKNLSKNLVPERAGNAPDYFCTWNLQGYVCSNSTNEAFRYAMNEKSLFGKGKYENWVDAYPEIRKDLYFVVDDSWDIPLNANNTKDNPYLGSVELDTSRFPSFKGQPVERLHKFVNAIKAKGWKGAGGWICAQESSIKPVSDTLAYWKKRLVDAEKAGFSYWKVDWGKESVNGRWRKQLTELGWKYAPDVVIEHALDNDFISFSDVYRTYDVENVISQPTTIQRIASLLDKHTNGKAKGLINCEDEPYIAAALGCAIGIMRHQFVGNFPDGKQDWCFPPVGRDIKQRRDEVIRGVRWHRIAEPFGVGKTMYSIDTLKREDYWVFKQRETWAYWEKGRQEGDTIRASAPARISRGLSLPKIIGSDGTDDPYVLSCRYPNGAVAIATIGRALGRSYVSKPAKVLQQLSDYNHPIGVFGVYSKLTLRFQTSLEGKDLSIYAQDLAGNMAENITDKVSISGKDLIIPGDVIQEVGLRNASRSDKSDPGLVIEIINR